VSLSLAEKSVFGLSGPSTSFGIGGADGFGAVIEGSNNAHGTATATVGPGYGGFSKFPGVSRTQTKVFPLVCK